VSRPFILEFVYGGSRRSAQSAGPLREKPARCYTQTKIWSDSRHSKGPGRERAWGIGAGYYVVLSRILQMNFAEFLFHALG
jgi:hypothetical protein